MAVKLMNRDRVMGTLFGGLLLLSAFGCPAANPDAVRGPDGTIIRREFIDPILVNADLTEEEKRQALRDLGITDESLIDLLIRTNDTSTNAP